jgi:hypothetical protein
MQTATETHVRTYIQLAGSGQMLHCVDNYNDVMDRVEAARSASIRMSRKQVDNPMGVGLVNVRMIVSLGDDEGNGVVDAAFNPLHVLVMYRAHPDA